MQKIHIKGKDNWINDPNGFIYYKGSYHLFYQCFPYGPRWGRMHWGHAVSKDLVNWEDCGIALFPSKKDDRSGCFSGSAVEQDGKLYLYYTGVNYFEEDPEDVNLCVPDAFVSAQLLVTSEDGVHFDNIKDKRTVIPVLEDTNIGDACHTRDPKVWKDGDAWYMVLGSCDHRARGKLLFYRSTDLVNWTYMNSATKESGFGWMWECPDYFEVGQEKVLIFSPMGFLKEGEKEEEKEENQTICMLVDFEKESCKMELPDSYQFFDYGLDLYAPQSTLDEEGRRVVIAWVRMPEPVEGSWQGMQCIPRLAEVREGHIYFRVHPNIRRAFSKKITSLQDADESGYRLTFSLKDGESVTIGGYRISRNGKKICTDRSALYRDFPNQRTSFETPELRDGFQMEVYVDRNLIEVFANDGEAVISNTVYHLGTEIKTVGDVKIQMTTLE